MCPSATVSGTVSGWGYMWNGRFENKLIVWRRAQSSNAHLHYEIYKTIIPLHVLAKSVD